MVFQVKIRGPIRSVVMSLFLFVLLIAVKMNGWELLHLVRGSKEDFPELVVWQIDNCNNSFLGTILGDCLSYKKLPIL